MHIIKCKVENIKGAKSVEFEPNGESVTIGGGNGEGKSSAIDALRAALGGREYLPESPVTNGEEKGRVWVVLEKFKVTLEVDKQRKSRLKIEGLNGEQYQARQAMLDEIFGGLSFDPGLFISVNDDKRLAILKDVVKLDFSDLEEKYKKAYEERTLVGRQAETLKGKLAGRKLHEDVPENEISISETMAELEELQRQNLEIRNLNEEIKRNQRAYAKTGEDIDKALGRLDALESETRKVEAEIDTIQRSRDDLLSENERLKKLVYKMREGKAEERALQVDSQLKNAETTNAKIRENRELIKLGAEHAASASEYESLTKKMDGLKAEKKERLSSAKFPIDGLSFDANGVTFEGRPWADLSESERWEISLAIGFALNPQGIVFMRHSGGLDKKSRERLRQRSAALGVQLFLEVVDDQEDVQVLIEDGTVKANRLPVRESGEKV